jgi:hypothetical protein
VPFAHHGLQGLRTDGTPVPMALVETGPERVEVSFQDVIRGKPRDGVVAFRLPCVYHFRTRDAAGAFATRLCVLCVPVRVRGAARARARLGRGVRLPASPCAAAAPRPAPRARPRSLRLPLSRGSRARS